MGLLTGTKCYTIGPLECGCFKEARKWRAYVKDKLDPLGVRTLSPLNKMFKNFEKEGEHFNAELKEALKQGKYEWVHEQMKMVRNRDLAACDLSTFLIAIVEPGVPTYGSTDEIVTSKRNQKPVFLVIPDKGYSEIPIWLASYFKPNWVYKNLDEVINTIYKIDSGEIQVSNKNWKILDD